MTSTIPYQWDKQVILCHLQILVDLNELFSPNPTCPLGQYAYFNKHNLTFSSAVIFLFLPASVIVLIIQPPLCLFMSHWLFSFSLSFSKLFLFFFYYHYFLYSIFSIPCVQSAPTPPYPASFSPNIFPPLQREALTSWSVALWDQSLGERWAFVSTWALPSPDPCISLEL